MRQILFKKPRQFRRSMVEGELYNVTTAASDDTEYALLFKGKQGVSSSDPEEDEGETLLFRKVSTGQDLAIPVSEPGLLVEWEYTRSPQAGPLPNDPMLATDLARLYVKYGLAPKGKTPREVARDVQQGWRPFQVEGR